MERSVFDLGQVLRIVTYVYPIIALGGLIVGIWWPRSRKAQAWTLVGVFAADMFWIFFWCLVSVRVSGMATLKARVPLDGVWEIMTSVGTVIGAGLIALAVAVALGYGGRKLWINIRDA